MGQLRVTGLYTYPVKSCAGVKLQETSVTETGLALDREFMLVDEDLDFMSQRKRPEMALIAPTLGPSSITLRAPGMPDVEIPLEPDQEQEREHGTEPEPDDDTRLTVTVHGKPVAAQLVDPALDDWFTSFLPAHKHHRSYRLVRVRADQPRFINERYRSPVASNRVAFADGSAMLLASERSLGELNRRLREPVPMDRFRPNIVVDGDQLTPYEEDCWTELRIGRLQAFVTKACDRCVIPDVDQSTGLTGKAVRQALTARRGANAYDETNTGVFFAQNLNHVFVPGVQVRVGDVVEVISRNEHPNVLIRS